MGRKCFVFYREPRICEKYRPIIYGQWNVVGFLEFYTPGRGTVAKGAESFINILQEMLP